jgi:hypothetical protein
MRTIAVLSLTAVLFSASSAVAQDKAAVQKKLESEYQLTKTTADQSDIVTAGAVLVLQKDNLLMVATTTSGNQCTNTYRDGKFTQGGVCRTGEKLKKFGMLTSRIPGADKAPTTTTRTYVAGEKFWVTKIDVRDTGKDPGIVMDFFTDAVSDVRYKTSLLIPFKGSVPSADDALKLVAEVVKVAPSDDNKDAKGGGQQDKGNAPAAQSGQPAQPAPAAEPAPAPAATAEAAPAAIEPPPPPPADPPTVKLGQTPDEVVAALGQPTKTAKLATKEIYYYKDLKVIFVNGKVKDIQ